MMINVEVRNSTSAQSMNVSDTTTVLEAMERAGMSTTRGMISFNGCTLSASDMTKPMSELGARTDCTNFVQAVVKADNAATAVVKGGAMIISSAATPEDLKTLAKYRPEALVLKDAEKKKELFSIAVATNGYGCIGKYGAEFSTITDKDGHATITVMIPDDVGDKKEWAQEYLGVTILRLNQLEEQFASQLTDVTNEKQAVADKITVE